MRRALYLFWSEFKRLLPWLIIPFAFWLVAYGVVAIEPLIRAPHLNDWTCEDIDAPIQTLLLKGPTTVITSPIELCAAPPSLLTRDPEIHSAMAIRASRVVTDGALLVRLSFGQQPVLISEQTDNTTTSVISLPLGSTKTFDIRAPIRRGLNSLSLELVDPVSLEVWGEEISLQVNVEHSLMTWVWRLLKSLASIGVVPPLLAALFGFGVEVWKRQQNVREEEARLKTQGDEIGTLMRDGNYKEAWSIYQTALDGYKSFIEVYRRDLETDGELHPINWLPDGETKRFVRLWYENSDYGEESGLEEPDLADHLSLLFWASKYLECDTDERIRNLLQKRPSLFIALAKGEIYNAMDGYEWIQEHFEYDEVKALSSEVEDESITKGLLDRLVRPPALSLHDLGVPARESLFDEQLWRGLSIASDERLLANAPLLVQGGAGAGKTSLALFATLNLLREFNKKPGTLLRPFPCYTSRLPKCLTDGHFLRWLFAAVAQRLLPFLIARPEAWAGSTRAQREAMGTVIGKMHAVDWVERQANLRRESKLRLRGLLQAVELSANGDLAQTELEEYWLGVMSSAYPSPWDGIALIIDPSPSVRDASHYSDIIKGLVLKMETLSLYNVHMKLFISPSDEILGIWDQESLALEWSESDLKKLLDNWIEVQRDTLIDRFVVRVRDRLVKTASSPGTLLCLAEAWNALEDDRSESLLDADVLALWARQTKLKCDRGL